MFFHRQPRWTALRVSDPICSTKTKATGMLEPPCFHGRTFWVDPKCFGGFQDEHYTGTVQRLERLGATVSKFLEARVDCVVLARAERETASAPSTPTGASSASARGISVRAQRLQSGCGSSWPKSATSRAALQPSPAQFADNHGKQLLSAGELLQRLQGAEKRREKRAASGPKRSRKEDTAEGKGPRAKPPACSILCRRSCSAWVFRVTLRVSMLQDRSRRPRGILCVSGEARLSFARGGPVCRSGGTFPIATAICTTGKKKRLHHRPL